MSLTNFTIICLIVYIVTLKVVSVIATKSSKKTSEDYFIANREIGLFALAATTAASFFSSGTTVATPSAFYESGLDANWIYLFVLSTPIFLPIAVKLWKIGKDKSFITPGEVLGDYYNSKSLQVLAGICGILAMLPYATAQVVALGKIFEEVTAGTFPYFWGVSIVMLFIAVYLFVGGSKAVIWTDVIQGVIFSIILILAGAMSIKLSGGWGSYTTGLLENHSTYFTFQSIDISYYEAIAFPLSIMFLPYFIQRIFMARSLKAMIKSLLVIPFACFVLYTSSWLVGSSGHLLIDTILDNDKIIIAVFKDLLPYFSVFIVVTIFAACMSTVDSQLLSSGSIIAKDFRKNFVKEDSEIKEYRFSKYVTLLILILSYLWALTLEKASVLNLILLGIGLSLVFIPSFIGILYFKRTNVLASFFSILLGSITYFLAIYTNIFKDLFLIELRATTYTLFVSSIVFILFSLFGTKRFPNKHKEYQEILSGLK